jgi:hypothetical protein
MIVRFSINSRVQDPDTRENLIESIRLQATQQGMRAHVYGNSPTLTIEIAGSDEGRLKAFEAAVRLWARNQENGYGQL